MIDTETLIKLIAAYAVIHITYTDLGMELKENYATIMRHPLIVFMLVTATAITAGDLNIKHAAGLVTLFYLSNR